MKDICITCCWEGLVNGAWLVLELAFWPAVVYASVYAVGAIAFLANLRAGVGESGRLEVKHDSWAYMLARPYRYGRIKAAIERYGSLESAVRNELPSSWVEPTSICVIYARLLNMLLFVWPAVLVYLAAVSVLGTVLFGVLLGVGYVSPDFTSEGWVSKTDLRDWNNWPNSSKVMLYVPATYYVAAFGLYSVVLHFSLFLHALWVVLLIAICLLPVIGVIVAVVFGSRKVFKEKDDGTTKVGLAAEFLKSKKERWCKMVEIK